MSTSPLNAEDVKKHLKEHGWVRLSQVISATEAAHVRERLWKAKEAAEAKGDQSYIEHLDPNPSNVRVFGLLELDPVFRELIAHPKIIELVKFVLGEDFIISNFTANIARPGAQSMALHSDQSIIVSQPWHESWVLNAIWCLSDVYKENGATLYIPGSNKWQMRSEVPANAKDLLTPFDAKQGDVILMDGRVWHTSGSNVTKDQDRPLMFGAYSAGFLRPQSNWNAVLSPETQNSVSEELREWLGLGPKGNVGKTGDIQYNYLNKQYSAKL
jgi:ectoine hydroxylase-related dioxygenase (phytanoyl-CoA dioxygenase family)